MAIAIAGGRAPLISCEFSAGRVSLSLLTSSSRLPFVDPGPSWTIRSRSCGKGSISRAVSCCLARHSASTVTNLSTGAS